MVKMNWLIPTLVALVFFGLWGILLKYSTGKIDAISFSAFNALSYLVIMAVIFGYVWFSKIPIFETQLSFTREGIYLALLAGAISAVAVISEFLAFKTGSIAIVAPVIAVGVAAIVVIAGLVLFKEALTSKNIVGLLLALISIYLLSIP